MPGTVIMGPSVCDTMLGVKQNPADQQWYPDISGDKESLGENNQAEQGGNPVRCVGETCMVESHKKQINGQRNMTRMQLDHCRKTYNQ